METDEAPLDDKARRMRDLLSSFYTPIPSISSNSPNDFSRHASPDDINSPTFEPDQYMNVLAHKSNLEALLQKHVEMVAEIKNLDTDLQMLVYENYNKFICATDTIKRMKSNILGMEANMEQLLEKILSVQSRSDNVNTSLSENREHIEKLHRTCNLLRKIQFIYDLPDRLSKCIKHEAYADAVKFYTGAMPIFKAYGDSSFQDCKRASEEAIATIVKNLQEKLFLDSESMQVRAEAAVLLKQLNFPVDNLKARLLEKLKVSLMDIKLDPEVIQNVSSSAHKEAVHEFVEAIRAFKTIFPDSAKQMVKLAQDLVTKHFLIINEYVKTRIHATDLLGVLRIVWSDVLIMDEVLQDASISSYSLEAAEVAIKLYIGSVYSHLMQDISDSLLKVLKRDEAGEYPLEVALEACINVVFRGGRNFLHDIHKILDDNLEIVDKLRDLIIDSVQEGFQEFFRQLEVRFQLLSGRNSSPGTQIQGLTEGGQRDKVLPSLVLVLAQLSVFIAQTTIPKITEELAAPFYSDSVRYYEYRPTFAPEEISQKFKVAGESFLHLYVNMKTQRVSLILHKRFATPNWNKHKEPREVHMFVDLFLQELKIIGSEARQILPQDIRKHKADSNGSTSSSKSNSFREDNRSNNVQKGRNQQLLETHLAKLFKQKVEIFRKVEYTQESVIITIVKLCLKSLQEFVRLQTFNRSGFQQIHLDIQFLRTPLKEIAEDEAAMDFLLDEVVVAAVERCLDPIPLESPILDRLIQAKLAKE
ncbi:hypothetical protein RJT34_19331 [Clitoria ternatea]|uniref:Vacuolar protein sorting-associated protein 51 homolog n=1 Tax=Clitoria ternatea TaxID=43366 RepID=A0AAN9P3K0_CLITE